METAGDILIRAAEPADAEAILGLKQATFATTTLRYTIYQAPQSVHYLRRLISETATAGANYLYVAVQNNQIIGYYHALRQETQFFLNYIVITGTVRGQGVGTRLLLHCEGMGRAIGCRRLVLDALANNQVVLLWYQRRGYRPEGSFFHVRLAVNKATDERVGARPQWSAAAWDAALQQEKIQGFSRVDGFYGTKAICLGLIGGQVGKLLEWSALELTEVVPAILDALRDDRQALLISNLPELPLGLPVTDFLEVHRLVKEIG